MLQWELTVSATNHCPVTTWSQLPARAPENFIVARVTGAFYVEVVRGAS